MKKILIIFIFFINCKSMVNNDIKAKYATNDAEINDLVLAINQSNIDFIRNERDLLLNSNLNIEPYYLDKLNRFIDSEDLTFNEAFLKMKLKILFEKIQFENITEIQMVYMHYSAEMITDKLFFLIKESNSYSIVKCSFTNYNDSVAIDFESDYLYALLDEYRENLKLSYESKSLFNNPPQYFFINKIKFSNKEVTSIETTFLQEMLLSQKFTLESYFK